mmetsp:Transcript_42500/g.83793  ORF Transcript_42500/g.83793 Transcript_42500/m.83793 type:complete len:223 (+) Transcript_42500:1117-1785(+)
MEEEERIVGREGDVPEVSHCPCSPLRKALCEGLSVHALEGCFRVVSVLVFTEALLKGEPCAVLRTVQTTPRPLLSDGPRNQEVRYLGSLSLVLHCEHRLEKLEAFGGLFVPPCPSDLKMCVPVDCRVHTGSNSSHAPLLQVDTSLCTVNRQLWVGEPAIVFESAGEPQSRVRVEGGPQESIGVPKGSIVRGGDGPVRLSRKRTVRNRKIRGHSSPSEELISE